MSSGSRGWRALWLPVVCVAGLMLPAAGSAAEFVEYYKLGLAAIESQQWDRAAEMMEKAIAEQPNAKVRVTKSFFFRRYLPHFYLGQARYARGDCRGALAAWRESENQAVVTRYPEYQTLQEGRAACSRISTLQTALDEALGVITQAESATANSRRQLAVLPQTGAGVATLLERQAAAEASIGRARRQIESPNVSLEEVEQVAALAAAITRECASIEQVARNQRQAQLEQRQEEAIDNLDQLEQSARRALTDSEYLRPYPESVSLQRQRLLGALERATSAAGGNLSLGEVEALQGELERATRALRQATEPPPKELTAAVAAFFSRDYGGVLEQLAEPELGSARATSHAHLLRAAALFAQYRVSGAADDELLQNAAQEVKACYLADAGRTPPSAVFSPSFIAFFDHQVTGLQAEDPAAVSDDS